MGATVVGGECWPGRFGDGSSEPARQLVPPRRGRHHAHAHRLVRDVRRAGAAVCGSRGSVRQQAARCCRDTGRRCDSSPASSGRPVWVDDPHFHLGYHVRHTALPPPGGEKELNTLMSRLMSVELDRHRPLVGGVGGRGPHRRSLGPDLQGPSLHGRWDLRHGPHGRCSSTRAERTPPPADTWTPAPEPSDDMLVVAALRDLLLMPAEQLRAARPRAAATAGRRRRRSGTRCRAPSPSDVSRGRPALSIEGSIGPHRRWAAGRASLDDLKQIRSVLGGTVNDVVLAVITGAFRDLLLSRGDPVDHVVLRSLVPVSVRADGRSHGNNQVSASIVELPSASRTRSSDWKPLDGRWTRSRSRTRPTRAGAITTMAAFTAAMLYALGLRSARPRSGTSHSAV